MTNDEFLNWIADRLVHVYGESPNVDFVYKLRALAQPEQEPVAKPYAYEYARGNGDGTYSVVIDKGDLVQTSPAVYNYVRPRNPHKDWPVKELFDHAPPQRKPLTDEEMKEKYREQMRSQNWEAYDTWLLKQQNILSDNEIMKIRKSLGPVVNFVEFARAIEAAHGIKE